MQTKIPKNIIHFNSPSLTFSIQFFSRPDVEGWLNGTSVSVDTRNFSGGFSCDIHIDDILYFYTDLNILHKQSGERREKTLIAEFKSIEEDIQIIFEMNILGEISGNYTLGNPTSCVLEGVFEIDQTYLQPFLLNIKSTLESLLGSAIA